MEELKNEINELRKDVKELKEICSGVKQHITFVEGVYDKAKAPLDYVCAYFAGSSLEDAPTTVNGGEEVD